MSPSELCHIKHCCTSNDVWVKLDEVYHSKGPARKATLLKQLLFSKMKDGESMMDHLNSFFGTIDKLFEMDIVIAQDLLTILLLYSIPESYENFRCAIEARDDLPTPESLKIKLLEEFNARKEKSSLVKQQQHDADAYYAKYGNQNHRHFQRKTNPQTFANKPSGSVSNKKGYKCNFCKKTGHKAAECWSRGRSNKQSVSNAEEDAFTVVENKNQTEKVSLGIALQAGLISMGTSWCIDSGATSHMCHDRQQFVEFTKIQNQTVRLAVDKTTDILGKGTVRLDVICNNNTKTIRLDNVLYVPELKTNLLSIAKTVSQGYMIHFDQNDAVFKNSENKTILTAARRGDLYFIEASSESTSAASAKLSQLDEWHQRFGHLNEKDLKKIIAEGMVKGIPNLPVGRLSVCEICIRGKQSAEPFPKQSQTKTNKLLELVHSDVCGPMRTTTIGGASYFATFVDDYSRYVDVCFLKAKSDVKEAFINYKNFAENQTELKIKTLRTDNGLEYCGPDFSHLISQAGIRREHTVAYTPQQNGTAERMNRTLVEMARCMMLQSNLAPSFWGEAIATAVYIRNRCPTKKLNNMTPFEVRYGYKPDVSHFKTFGCKAFALNKKPSKGKFESRSTECTFIGYSTTSKAYRLWDPERKKVIVSRDVKFVEQSICNEVLKYDNNIEFKEFETIFDFEKTSDTKIENVKNKIENKNQHDTKYSKPKVCGDDSVDDFVEKSEPDCGKQETPLKRGPGRPKIERTGRRGRPRKLFSMLEAKLKPEAEQAEEANQVNVLINPTLKEAMEGSNSCEWRAAMESEFNALRDIKAWELVERPKNKKVIGCRWVLRTKYNADGSIERHKARLVAKGCSQQPGIDFQETFAPVARQSSIRILMALAAEFDLQLFQLDVEMAYINGDLEEEILMEQAEGFIKPGEEHLVCSLKRALYGLKQSGRRWYIKLEQKLLELGLTPLNTEKCIYLMETEDTYMVVVIYVDDLIIATNNLNAYENLKNYMSQEFKMKDLGKLHYCLGIEFNQDMSKNTVTMNQSKYIQSILLDYGMNESKVIATPLDGNVKLSKDMAPKTEKERSEMESTPYSSLIGSLMYLAVSTRPDIAHTVSVLSQYNSDPGQEHWKAAKRVLRYLQGTQNLGLVYRKSDKPQLFGYVDSDWGGNIDDRKSYTGFAFILANAAVTWESRKQKSVALSSTEAEYMALTEAAKETIYLRNLLKELGFLNHDTKPTIVYCDNQGAQKLMKNPTFHSRTKHVDIRHHYIREVFDKGEIEVQYLPTAEMLADVLTKSLFGPSHRKCIKGLGIGEEQPALRGGVVTTT